jgi:hypothetical protein
LAAPAPAPPRPSSAPHTGLGNGEKLTPPVCSVPAKSLATLQEPLNASIERIMARRALSSALELPAEKQTSSDVPRTNDKGVDLRLTNGRSAEHSSTHQITGSETTFLALPNRGGVDPASINLDTGPSADLRPSAMEAITKIKDPRKTPPYQPVVSTQTEEGAPGGSACSAAGKSGDTHSNSASIGVVGQGLDEGGVDNHLVGRLGHLKSSTAGGADPASITPDTQPPADLRPAATAKALFLASSEAAAASDGALVSARDTMEGVCPALFSSPLDGIISSGPAAGAGPTLAIEAAQVKQTSQTDEGASRGSACSAAGKSGDTHTNSASFKNPRSVSFLVLEAGTEGLREEREVPP